ncbi:MAG: DUF4157 domain-containing protein [Hydrogenophilales bacterium]|nr:DUF4157 domain-containing protein [Hydrogenophilales bacterium]
MTRQAVSQAPSPQQKAGVNPFGLLQRKCACGSHTLAGSECGSCGKKKRSGLQTKLAVDGPADVYEQEADRVADRVAAMPAHSPSHDGAPRIQRLAGAQAGNDMAPSSVGQALEGTGSPLAPALRRDMEQRFDHDFSQVRIHTGHAAERSAADVNALAYTVGRNIVFGAHRFAPGSQDGRRLLAHELTHVVQQSGGGNGRHKPGPEPMKFPAIPSSAIALQRKCGKELQAPEPECKESKQGVGGWQFLFKVGCDELLPGEDAKIGKLKPGRKLNIHGFASQEGGAGFNWALSCHRANVIAVLAKTRRPDCPILDRFKHGPTPATGAGAKADPNPREFWRSVVVEEIRPTPEAWLDPASVISQGRQLYVRAKNNPSQANLDTAAAHRAKLKGWLESIPKSVAPQGAQLDRKDLTDYRQFYLSAEGTWQSIDKLLADQGHAAAASDTYAKWAVGTGIDSGSDLHAKHVPAGARYHVDLFGEGFFPGAINVGMAERTSTTGVSGSRVPNLIYRKFSATNAAVNRIPIADHVADLVTSENGPLMLAGLIDEIARIVAPGGTIVLYGPDNMERYHDQIAKAVGGTIRKDIKNGAIESTITVPGP